MSHFMGELWGVYGKDLAENLHCYKSTALYIPYTYIQCKQLGQFVMPKTLKNWIGVVNSCDY